MKLHHHKTLSTYWEWSRLRSESKSWSKSVSRSGLTIILWSRSWESLSLFSRLNPSFARLSWVTHSWEDFVKADNNETTSP